MSLIDDIRAAWRRPELAEPAFVIRLRDRTAKERMGRNGSPRVLEVGYVGVKGGAIAVYVGHDEDLTDTANMERLFAMALELWERERKQIVARKAPSIVVPIGYRVQ